MSLNWRGAWNAGSTYQVDDVVFYLTASYVAQDISTNQPPIQANIGNYWGTFAVGLQGLQGPRGYNGATSTVPGPQGDDGAQGGTGQTGQGFVWRNSWSSTIIYNAYDCVGYTDGKSYICIADSVQNVIPSSDIVAQGTATIWARGTQPITFTAAGYAGSTFTYNIHMTAEEI